MRYWIWWNDLIQGPFELDELISLRAFSEDLLVCMEDREEWLPAGRIADLVCGGRTAENEPGRDSGVRRLLPPRPTGRRPRLHFKVNFSPNLPGQQTLLGSEDEPKGPYAQYAFHADGAKRSDSARRFISWGRPMRRRSISASSRAVRPSGGAGNASRVATAGILGSPDAAHRKTDHRKKIFLFTHDAFKESPARQIQPAVEEKREKSLSLSVPLKILQDDAC